MDTITIPADSELVGTQFPGQMPDTTWAEILAWFEQNDVDLDRCPATRDVIITDTIDRWEILNGQTFRAGEPTRGDGVTLANGQEWSHHHPGREHTARPVQFVSTPVKVPLPDHLRDAITRAVAGEDLPGGLRTPAEWSAQYAIEVVERNGWIGNEWHTPITEQEFVERCSKSKLREIPLKFEQEMAATLISLLGGGTHPRLRAI